MKLSCIALAAVAAAGSVSASAVARGGDAYHHDKPPCGGSCPPPQPPIPPPRPSPDSDTCPIAQCVVDTTNTYWDFAYVASPPLLTLPLHACEHQTSTDAAHVHALRAREPCAAFTTMCIRLESAVIVRSCPLHCTALTFKLAARCLRAWHARDVTLRGLDTHTNVPAHFLAKNSNLRPNPCNNKPALKVMYTGDAVYDLLVPYKSGCGYTYAQVLLPALDNGQEQMIGWMDVNALNCHSHNKPIPPPAPAPAAEEVLVDDNSSPQS